MRRLNLKPTSKSVKPAKTRIDVPATKKNQTVSSGYADSEVDGAKLATGFGVAGIAASLICLVVFFQSDIPTKIVAAKSAHAAEMQAQADKQLELTTSGGDEQTVGSLPVVEPSEETVSDVSHASSGADGADGSDGRNGQDGADGSAIIIAPGAVISSEDLAGYLQEMTADDFTALAESVDMLIASDPTIVNLPGRKSLAEAYAEAESKYPGQIDGTKRLKLVDELNAIDYTYYVAESGDTLLALSNTFEIPLGQLVEINGIHEADEIDAGAILLFPSETVQPE